VKFSLIVCTLGRVAELERLLASLAAQSHTDFEVIVVDQNADGRLAPLLAAHASHLMLRHLRCAPGLSRSRNLGLHHATGDVIAFPDDDCWYPDELLAQVAAFFEEHPLVGGLSGRATDEQGRNVAGRWDRQAGLLTLENVWRRAISFTIFLRRGAVMRLGPFDETLGVGAGTPFGSGEETEYLIRALKAGTVLFYSPRYAVYHPEVGAEYGDRAAARALGYGLGMGRVLRLHRYGAGFVLRSLVRPLGGGLLFFLMGQRNRARFHLNVARGRWAGWRQRP
jgi:glycosyltransferase involved in cell wall biosynthesis